MLKATDLVSVTITLSREVMLTDDAATVARLAGITLDQLSAVVEDGDDWEPEESTLSDMADQGDVTSEEWDWTEIVEA